MKSVMSHSFAQVPSANIPRSTFDRSHGWKGTFDTDLLIPFYVDEAVPGDTFNLKANVFARLATPITPLMDNVFLETFFFATPNRLLWDNWEKFNGAQDNPSDSIDFTIPTISASIGSGRVWDYMGLPTATGSAITFSALPSRAYNLIYNEWFRDQNLQTSVVLDTDDGPDTYDDYKAVLVRGKRHDYFTSALPWPQKGDSVSIPLGTTAPVTTTPNLLNLQSMVDVNGNPITSSTFQTDVNGDWQDTAPLVAAWLDPGGSMTTDLSSASAATINQLRQAFQIQKLQERDARGGTRYTEIIRAHFGVISPDQRLQRPEYLGGGSELVNINQVEQTSSTDATTPQGNLAGYGTVSAMGHGFTKSFTEHCTLVGLLNVRADLTYQQGIDRMWSRSTRYDFYWPALAHIGEQTILSKEIYSDGTANDDDVFGYQERYAEYRYKPSRITGQFRSNHGTTLDYWHLSQEFSSRPLLGDTFIKSTTPMDRVVATPSEPHFICDAYFNLRCARPMPVQGVPGNIDRF